MHDAAAIRFRFEKRVEAKGSEDKGAMKRYPSKPAHSLQGDTAGPALVSWHGFGRPAQTQGLEFREKRFLGSGPMTLALPRRRVPCPVDLIEVMSPLI